MSWKTIKEGDRVQINAFSHKGQKGYVRYKGEVEGLMGEMLGIELDDAKGKNDGTHGDTRYFQCEENFGIFFRSAQVKVIEDDGGSAPAKSVKKPLGLKKPSGGLKAPASATKADDESKEEEAETPKTTRESSKVVKGGLKGPTRASAIKKPAGEAATGGESSRASKISKVKAGSRLAGPKTGLKKPDPNASAKKAEGAKSIAQKKEEMRNKVRAKKGIPATGAKATEEKKSAGIKKFTRPKKPSDSPVKTSARKKPDDEDEDDAAEAKREASFISSKTSESRKTETKPKATGGVKRLGLKKPSAADAKKLVKTGATKTGLKRAPASKTEESKSKLAKKEPEKKVSEKESEKDSEKDKDSEIPTENEETKDEDEDEDFTPPALDDEEEDEDFTKKSEEKTSEQKKVLKRIPPGATSTEGPSGSNLKMLQQAKIDVAKKEAHIEKLNEEMKELYSKIKSSDEVHTAEMEIQRLEFEARIQQRDEQIEENMKKVQELLERSEKAESNARVDGAVTVTQEKMGEMKKKEDEFKKKEEEFKKREEEFKKQLEQKDAIVEELNQEIEKYGKDAEEKDQGIENLKLDIETIQVEKQILEEEKELMEADIQQQEEDRLKDMEGSMTDDDLKYQNEKLRIALRKLNTDVEVERVQWEEQLARIPELEAKAQDVDVLLEAVEERDEEIEAMKETVEEATEFQQMVEELTEEIVEKEELIEELEEKIAEMEEVQAVQEQINADQEVFEKEMQDEIIRKDIKIQELENDVQILEEALLEQDDKETKHKDRLTELTNENMLLKEQLNSAYDDQTKNKIGDMIDKQKKLINELRESSRKEISGSLSEINLGISNTLADLYKTFIPEKLLKEGYISNFDRIRLVIYVKNKAQLTYNELCKKKFIEGADFAMGEGQMESYEFFKYMCKLGENSARCVNLCQKILHALTFMDAEKYKKIGDSSFWQNFVTANSFLDNMIKMIKDDTLTTKVSQDPFEETLQEFNSFYLDNIRGAVNEHLHSSGAKQEFDIDQAPKNIVKEHVMKIGLAILALGFYTRQRDFYLGKDADKSLQEKCKQVFRKMMDSVKAVDEIEQDDHGIEFFKSNINGVKRIQDKYEFVQTFWEKDSMAFDKESETTEETKDDGEASSASRLSQSSQNSQINYDWYAWLDSVDREMVNIMSEQSMVDLREKVKKENPSPFLKRMSKGPWITLAESVKAALSQSDAMREENEKMKEKVKEQNISYVKLKKTKEDLEIIKESLERKIAELELDSQKLQPLISEKKRLEEKLKYIQEELSTKEKIINTQKEKIDKLSVEKEESAKQQPADSRRSTVKGRGSNRKSMLNKLLAGGKKDKSDAVMDDSTLEMLDDLQEQNVKLKRSALFDRILQLSDSTPAFNTFMKESKMNVDRHDGKRPQLARAVRLTDEESADLQTSVSEIHGIKNSMKLKMCQAKVFKIGEKNEESIVTDSKSYLKETTQHKKQNMKELSTIKAHVNKINTIMFSGQSQGEFSTSFQTFTNTDSFEKVKKSSDWQVIGRVKIKPPNSQANPGNERVEKIYLDQFSAHRVLRALPTLPSIC